MYYVVSQVIRIWIPISRKSDSGRCVSKCKWYLYYSSSRRRRRSDCTTRARARRQRSGEPWTQVRIEQPDASDPYQPARPGRTHKPPQPLWPHHTTTRVYAPPIPHTPSPPITSTPGVRVNPNPDPNPQPLQAHLGLTRSRRRLGPTSFTTQASCVR